MSDLDELDTLLSGQLREFIAASAAESDLDMAFHLQLAEAISASLALLPSTSSSSSSSSAVASSSSAPPPPPPPLPAADDGGLADAIRLQDLEKSRFCLGRRDDYRRHDEPLHLVRHASPDERFSHQILRIPDGESGDLDGEFERPIERLTDEEKPTFRLYFKGMSKGEIIEGKYVQLAAIAFAICDQKGDLVLKIQKPVSMLPANICREVLEFEALIEGLKAVASLEIERVDVLCDYKTLYNHVTGIWGIKKILISDCIYTVKFYQRKFRKCQLILLPKWRIKFVFKLVKDAIDSQRTKNAAGSTSTLEHCVICLEILDSSQFFSSDGCSHRFCFSCMKQHVKVRLLHGFLPSCPHDGCHVKLNIEGASKFLTPRLLDIMAQRIKEASIPANEKVYCPYPKCSALMSLSEAILPHHGSSFSLHFIYTTGLRSCVNCKGSFCINCKVPWHHNMSCNDYKRLNPHPPELAKLKDLASQKLWRQCANCRNMIELAEGCFHMTCRCGHEFCYTCGAEWKDKKSTCSCPLWDEGYIWNDDSEDENSDDIDSEDDDYDDYSE